MAIANENLIPSKSEKKDDEEKHGVNLQFHYYLPFFAIIYLGSYFIPGIIFMLYVLLFFKPFYLENNNIISLFTEFKPLLALVLMPLIIIGCYLLHLFFVGLLTRMLWRFTERKCPTQDGIILRSVPSDTLNYYHIRSFLIKYGKNVFTKGLFPWLANWFFNFVGSNKIGKGTTIEEEIVADKFIDVGDNCYIGVNSAICSHTVEGIFGRIPYFEIKIGNNVTCTAFNIVGPGCELKDNSYILPLGSFGKNQTTKGNNYYFGLPARKIFKKKIMDFLKITEDDLEKNKDLKRSYE
jgi:acetyltransferase-like isoleucine patch superfamily enzyme